MNSGFMRLSGPGNPYLAFAITAFQTLRLMNSGFFSVEAKHLFCETNVLVTVTVRGSVVRYEFVVEFFNPEFVFDLIARRVIPYRIRKIVVNSGVSFQKLACVL